LSVAASFDLQGGTSDTPGNPLEGSERSESTFKPAGPRGLAANVMRNKFELQDYEPVTRSRKQSHFSSADTEDGLPQIRAVESIVVANKTAKVQSPLRVASNSRKEESLPAPPKQTLAAPNWALKRGHSLTYIGLFVFTFLVYFRPYELFPSLAWLSRSALVVAILTLIIFVPSQLGLENRITVKLREVQLALALLVTGLLSIPFALEPTRAFLNFVDFLKVIVMFIVMVNVVRTEKRLRGLILLVLFVSCVLSVAALNDYAQGNLVMRGTRIAGFIGGLFSNPNDLALHLVTMVPISLSLLFASRGPLNKALYLGCALLMTLGTVATFSRAGFLGFVCMIGFFVWKLARRNRVFLGAVALTVVVAAVALAPGAYQSRLATTSDDSAVARTDDLKRSILVTLRHPLFGVGMDNYILYSNTDHATHNAYTQVASEMGVAALLFYLGFLLTPFKGLRRIEQANRPARRRPPIYYLSVGLQASLVGYMVVSFFASVAYQWYAYYLVAYAICLQRLASVDADSTLKLRPISE
jgi:probable O-glycosylation ligase (exosortase A-associated)